MSIFRSKSVSSRRKSRIQMPDRLWKWKFCWSSYVSSILSGWVYRFILPLYLGQALLYITQIYTHNHWLPSDEDRHFSYSKTSENSIKNLTTKIVFSPLHTFSICSVILLSNGECKFQFFSSHHGRFGFGISFSIYIVYKMNGMHSPSTKFIIWFYLFCRFYFFSTETSIDSESEHTLFIKNRIFSIVKSSNLLTSNLRKQRQSVHTLNVLYFVTCTEGGFNINTFAKPKNISIPKLLW